MIELQTLLTKIANSLIYELIGFKALDKNVYFKGVCKMPFRYKQR